MKKKAISLQRAAHWSDCGPLRFVVLSRLSDDEQAIGADTSLDAQERLCKLAVGRYISEHGGQLVTCIRGEKTGTTLKRNDWKEVLALAEKRAFDVLVSVRMDRVARGSTYTERSLPPWSTCASTRSGSGAQRAPGRC
ncbi:MAG: recombinase family protein [Armatimonadetes bacterium]|nr:recombinase family protein [Armatimonadota bacterium]